MNIDGMTLFFFSLSPPLSAGPHKPQALTASKIEYEIFDQKFQFPYKKVGILVP